MTFDHTEDQKLLKKTARRLAEEEFAKRAFKWEGEYPLANVERLAQVGLLGISLPEAYGGGGLTFFEEILVQEEIGRICPDTAFALANLAPARMIAEFGSEELRRTYIPPVLQGKMIGIAISEPEAGSAITEMKMRAEDRGASIVLTGEKIFISHADQAIAFVVFARFQEGIGAVIVDREDPGLQMGKPDVNMAGGRHYSLYFDHAGIPREQILLRGEGAFKQLMGAFNAERCGSAMWGVCIALAAFDKAIEYARQRKQFGKTLSEFQGIQWMLAEMAIKIESARLLTCRAAANAASGFPSRLESSMAKAVASQIAEEVTSDALQIHGAYAYMKGHPLEYLYRLARGRKIGGGTVEIQKNMIAAELLKHGLR
jgi:alkylation response protein AidB-like acyl-CoA dehydrogenase